MQMHVIFSNCVVVVLIISFIADVVVRAIQMPLAIKNYNYKYNKIFIIIIKKILVLSLQKYCVGFLQFDESKSSVGHSPQKQSKSQSILRHLRK